MWQLAKKEIWFEVCIVHLGLVRAADLFVIREWQEHLLGGRGGCVVGRGTGSWVFC